jgi:hypothetical protein
MPVAGMLLVRLIYNKTGTKRLSCSNNNPCRRGARSGARVAKPEYEKLTDALPGVFTFLCVSGCAEACQSEGA